MEERDPDRGVAADRGGGPVRVRGGHRWGGVRYLRVGGAGAGVAARGRGGVGQLATAQERASDRRGRGGGGAGGTVARVQPRSDAGRGAGLEGERVASFG